MKTITRKSLEARVLKLMQSLTALTADARALVEPTNLWDGTTEPARVRELADAAATAAAALNRVLVVAPRRPTNQSFRTDANFIGPHPFFHATLGGAVMALKAARAWQDNAPFITATDDGEWTVHEKADDIAGGDATAVAMITRVEEDNR